MTRREFALLPLVARFADDDNCNVSVLSLLRPRVLQISSASNARLHCTTNNRETVVEGRDVLNIDSPASVSGADGSPAGFTLEIPNVIRRRYFGTLKVNRHGSILFPVVSMDREIAVGSIIGAELPVSSTPFHALAAQAVASRTFLYAARTWRHAEAQVCDTTHCQFLRSPAPAGSSAARACQETSRLILTASEGNYSAACGVCEACRAKGLARSGHGLGLCQAGAVALAQVGWRWVEILRRYFPGISIRSI